MLYSVPTMASMNMTTCRAVALAPALPGASRPLRRNLRGPFFGGTATFSTSLRTRGSSARCKLAPRADADGSTRASRLAPKAAAESTLERVAEAPEDVEQSAVEPEQGQQAFSWQDQWWPCVFVKDLDPQKAYPFTLLGEPIVIWRDGAGAWHAFHDACPHRLIPLSEGRISPEGQLECAYHGWRFEGGGRCTAMPQGGDPANPRACATAYHCQVKQGLVWVKPQPPVSARNTSAAPASDIPTLPELEDGEWLGFGDMWRDLPYDYSTLLENVLDAGHVPFTHHGTVSKRQSSGLYQDMRITERGPWGFKGVWPTGPRRGGLGSQATHFRAPSLMRHTIDALDNRGFANITAVYAVPTTPGRCRAFVRQPFRFRNRLLPQLLDKLPQFLGHLGNLDVLDDDVVFLHLQEQEQVKRGMGERPAGQVYYMPGASDAYVSGFRNWLQRVGGGGPFGPQNKEWLQAAGPRLPVKDLLDHYHSHTEQCETCSTALGRLRVLRVVAAVGAAVSGLASIACLGLWLAVTQLHAFQSVVPSAGVPLLLHGAWVSALIAAGVGTLATWCHRTIPRFYTGKHPPARNTVPGEWAP